MTVSRRDFATAALLSPVLAAGCGSAAARSAPRPRRPWDAFDDYLAQQAAAGRFSGAALVAVGGRPVLERAAGMADRRRGIANTVRTRFCLCSMGKMFTAVAIAQLVGRGELSFRDPIARFVSGYGFPSAIADRVTVDQLLTHTAGMGDVLQPDPTSQPPRTLAGMMKRIAGTPLLFEPGSRFGYSNSGYVVLGAIIESVARTSYRTYLHEHVFGPAGMASTDVREYRPVDVPDMAHPYADTGAGIRDVGRMVQIGNPSGGGYSTVTDMMRFARAVTGDRLLSPALTRTVLAGKVPASGPGRPPDDRYAYGFDDTRINGVRIVGHNGGSPGYEGQLDCYPDRDRIVVVLTNTDGVLVPVIQTSERILTA